jgi:DeoD family purine-nucleoside phosphorylase
MTPLEETDLPAGDAPHTLHLNPASQFHPRVLLPGDPARAMAIATRELTAPRMFNHRRGLWGYSGETPDGVGFVIQSSGMGGPSAAIIVEELCDLGAEIIVRVGTCGALEKSVGLGDLIVVSEAICDDGTSAALAAQGELPADRELSALLAEHARRHAREEQVHSGRAATVDLFYDPDASARHDRLLARGALAIEMEAAALFAVAARRGVRAACLLGVSDVLHGAPDRLRLTQDEITELGETLGTIGVAAVRAAG